MRRIVAPSGLRRRLTVAFSVLTVVSTGVLATGSYVLVRSDRLSDFAAGSVTQTRLNLTIARQNLPPSTTDRTVRALLAAYEGGGFETVLVAGDRTYQSALSVGEGAIPGDLAALVARERLAYERTSAGGVPYLVTGAPVSGTDARIFFFFDEATMRADLDQLGRVLLAGCALFVILAVAAGALLARQMLGPVARASSAARSMAEGLLSTRLPVESGDEFGAWAASFNEMAEALQSKIDALSEARERERRFTSDVAHELRTPLTALVAEAEMLKEHVNQMPPGARRPAELLIGDVARLRKLIEELMEISRLDSERAIAQMEPMEIRVFLGSILSAHGWNDLVAFESEEIGVLSDGRRLERVIVNLLSNALEHGVTGAALRARRVSGDVLIEVSDKGPGISAHHLEHIFDRFYKTDPARTGRGSGLGLAIALENARLLGGDIAVTSVPGDGTVFTVRLPVTESLHHGDSAVALTLHDEPIATNEKGVGS